MKHLPSFSRFFVSLVALMAGILTACAKEPDFSALITIGRETVSVIESVQERLAGLVVPFLEMHEKGVDNVSKEYWDTKVAPVLLAADKDLVRAADNLAAVLPEKFNPRSKDPKDEPWISVYNVVSGIRFADLKRQADIYDNEYLMLIVQAKTYVSFYATLFHGRYEMLEREKNRLTVIIADPAGFRTRQIEQKEREEREAAEKGRKEKEEMLANALRKTPVRPDPSWDRYNSPFSYAGVPLGLEFHDYVGRLKSRGFKLERQETQKDLFYGYTPVAFLTGTQEGNPVRVKVTATALSYRVFEIDATIEKIIDEYESEEIVNLLAADFAGKYPDCEITAKEGSQTISLTDMVDSSGRLFKKTGIPSGGLFMRLYSEPGVAESYLGVFYMEVYQDMSKGFFIKQHFYDYKLGQKAREEER